MEQNQTLFSLNIDPVTKAHLNETAKWARFLSILGMIVLALGLIAAVMGSTVFSTFDLTVADQDVGNENLSNAARLGLVIGMLVVTLIAFFPLLFLLRFANGMLRSIRANDQRGLNSSFLNLKVYFRYLGVVTIVLLIFYGLVIAIGIMGVAAAG